MTICKTCHQELPEALSYRKAPLAIIPPVVKSPHLIKVIGKVLGRNLLAAGKWLGAMIGLCGLWEGLGWLTSKIIPMREHNLYIYFPLGLLVFMFLLLVGGAIYYLFAHLIKSIKEEMEQLEPHDLTVAELFEAQYQQIHSQKEMVEFVNCNVINKPNQGVEIHEN